ncbi:MAG: PAS domain S-box protein, partial [Burkholderiales bacterium]
MSSGRTADDRLAHREGGRLASLRRMFAGGFGVSMAIAAFGVLLVGLLWGTVFFKVRAEKAAEIQTVTKDTGNLARVFEEHVLRTIREADQVLQFIIDQHRDQGRAVDLRRLKEDGPIISRIYTHLSIADARGNLIAGSHPAGKVNIAERDHFRVHVASDTGQLFISRPAFGQASGTWTIQLSRRINNPDLSFGGVAVVSIDPQYFARLYSQTDLGDQAMITLVGRDGVVRARRSRNEANATVDTSKWALFKLLPSSPNGSYISTGSVDGLKRIFSFRSLADYPLVVLVGAAENEALAEFHERRRGYIDAAELATLVILGFTAFLIAMVRRQENMARALQRHNAELGQALEANTRLAAIVEYSNDAIISRALDGTVTSWNAGAERLFGYAAADAIGRPISDLILPPEIRERVAQNVENIRRGNIVAPYETRRRT